MALSSRRTTRVGEVRFREEARAVPFARGRVFSSSRRCWSNPRGDLTAERSVRARVWRSVASASASRAPSTGVPAAAPARRGGDGGVSVSYGRRRLLEGLLRYSSVVRPDGHALGRA